MTSAPAEARHLIASIAGGVRLGENVKGALTRVARATGLPQRRVRGIWNSEARSIRAEEMDRLRAAARETRATEEAHDAYATLLVRLAACEAALGLSAENVAGLSHPSLRGRVGVAHRTVDRAEGPMTTARGERL